MSKEGWNCKITSKDYGNSDGTKGSGVSNDTMKCTYTSSSGNSYVGGYVSSTSSNKTHSSDKGAGLTFGFKFNLP